MLWICQPQGRPPTSSAAMSAPVKTATTPGAFAAAAVSMPLIVACGRSARLMNGVDLAGPVDVVGVVAVAAEEAHVLLAADGGADAFEWHVVSPCSCGAYSAAAWVLPCISGQAAAIALTMLW